MRKAPNRELGNHVTAWYAVSSQLRKIQFILRDADRFTAVGEFALGQALGPVVRVQRTPTNQRLLSCL